MEGNGHLLQYLALENSHGQRSLASCRAIQSIGRKESDVPEHLAQSFLRVLRK